MRKRRKIRKNMKNNYKKYVILFFFVVCVMTVGYGAFQTILNLQVSGHIYVTPDECFTVSDNGDGTGSITDYDMECGKKVVIPDVINDLTITKIADYNSETAPVFRNKVITYVKLPNNLSEIGKNAFHSSKISKIELPDTMRIIGPYAFIQLLKA